MESLDSGTAMREVAHVPQGPWTHRRTAEKEETQLHQDRQRLSVAGHRSSAAAQVAGNFHFAPGKSFQQGSTVREFRGGSCFRAPCGGLPATLPA